MNRNVVGAILIVAALALVYFYAWPKIRANIAPAPIGGGGEMTTTPI